MKIPLLTLNLNYTWLPNIQNFDSLEVKKMIYFDGFSKHVFFDTFGIVMHGYEIALSRYEEYRNAVKKGDSIPP